MPDTFHLDAGHGDEHGNQNRGDDYRSDENRSDDYRGDDAVRSAVRDSAAGAADRAAMPTAEQVVQLGRQRRRRRTTITVLGAAAASAGVLFAGNMLLGNGAGSVTPQPAAATSPAASSASSPAAVSQPVVSPSASRATVSPRPDLGAALLAGGRSGDGAQVQNLAPDQIGLVGNGTEPKTELCFGMPVIKDVAAEVNRMIVITAAASYTERTALVFDGPTAAEKYLGSLRASGTNCSGKVADGVKRTILTSPITASAAGEWDDGTAFLRIDDGSQADSPFAPTESWLIATRMGSVVVLQFAQGDKTLDSVPQRIDTKELDTALEPVRKIAAALPATPS